MKLHCMMPLVAIKYYSSSSQSMVGVKSSKWLLLPVTGNLEMDKVVFDCFMGINKTVKPMFLCVVC